MISRLLLLSPPVLFCTCESHDLDSATDQELTSTFSCINAFVVKWYGEAEFWLALGKVFLILIVYSFTFITMVGGNPKKDAYGVSHHHIRESSYIP
jgi:hypothetical protein